MGSSISEMPGSKKGAPGAGAGASSATKSSVPVNIAGPVNEFVQNEQQRQQTEAKLAVQEKKCQEISAELNRLAVEVDKFVGTTKDKEYLKLEELLTRCMLRLDEVERGEDQKLNDHRKSLINYTHQLSERLESMAQAVSTSLEEPTRKSVVEMEAEFGTSSSSSRQEQPEDTDTTNN